MQKSFEHAALELIKSHPVEVAEKFPELIQWKDVTQQAK
jgi:hypothetical protein